MKKMRVFAVSFAFVILLLYSCRMPNSVEIRTGNLELSVPLSATVNIAQLLRENLQEELDDIRVFDMVKYPGGAQAFLIAMELDMLPSFNPGDYLDYIGDMDDMGNIGLDPIEANIVVPRIAWDTVEVNEYFDMSGLFYTMEESLNKYSMPEFPPITSSIPIPLYPGMQPGPLTLPEGMRDISFFAFRDGDPGRANFDSVVISGENGGYNTIELELESAHPLPPGLSITLPDIRMVGETSRLPIGFPHSTSITLNEFNQSGVARIDISGESIELRDPPKFLFGEILVEYTGSASLWFTPNITASLRVNQISLRGARGLRIGTLEHPLPEGIIENIELDVPTGFLNAEIGSGMFAIRVDTPSRAPEDDQTTYSEGLQIGIKLAISQKAKDLGDESFGGLVGPWEFTSDTPFKFDELPLYKRRINGNNIVVDPIYSLLSVSSGPDGISFELHGEHYENKMLPVTITMEMNIARLDTIRWELDNELIPIPEIELDFSDMGGTDVTEFIERITFDRISAGLNISALDQALDGRIALEIYSPRLGFDAPPYILSKGKNDISSTASVVSPLTLDISYNSIVNINVGLVPVIGGMARPDVRYLEIGPFYISGEDETELNLSAEVTLDFSWTKADINLTQLLDEHNLSGGIPDEPINIREMLGDFMLGDFTFAENSLGIGLFLDGPIEIVNKINPSLTLIAYTGEGDGVNLFDGDIQIEGGFPSLPDDGIWEYPGLPPGGLQGVEVDKFIDIFTSKPEALSFSYEVGLGQDGVITVERDMFDDVEAGDIRALIVIKLALDFEVGKGAYFSLPLFEDEDDLLGRDEPGPLFDDIDLSINFLRIRLDFQESIFRGAVLHVDGGTDIPDEDILFGRGGLALGGGNYVEISITGNDLNIIERRLIPPDIRIEFPEPTPIRIPRNPLPIGFTVSVNGSLTFDL
ncbi:MAG: hypothetical protein FWB78_01820 [Treponema sp.]|nr:hypothetical protein [Treponema sp.]